MTRKPQSQLDWLKNEIKKDTKQLESEILKFSKDIKKFKKEDITSRVVVESKKMSLWMRIKKVLMG